MIFLCDVDEVLCDFSTPVLRMAEEMFGVRHPITEWDLFAPFTEEQVHMLRNEISREGFCESLNVVDGAQESVEATRWLGFDVYALTSPWRSRTWSYERMAWLSRYFGIDKDHIISTGAKSLVRGDLFLDDCPDHVMAWHKARTDALHRGMMMHTPFNAHATVADSFRVRTWAQVIDGACQVAHELATGVAS